MHKIVHVQAQPGRIVPLHRDDHRAGHADHHVLKAGHVCEVIYSTGIRRRIRSGDLKLVPAGTVSTPEPETTAPLELAPVAYSAIGTFAAEPAPIATPAAVVRK